LAEPSGKRSGEELTFFPTPVNFALLVSSNVVDAPADDFGSGNLRLLFSVGFIWFSLPYSLRIAIVHDDPRSSISARFDSRPPLSDDNFD
jgi:hypothetical protein